MSLEGSAAWLILTTILAQSSRPLRGLRVEHSGGQGFARDIVICPLCVICAYGGTGEAREMLDIAHEKYYRWQKVGEGSALSSGIG